MYADLQLFYYIFIKAKSVLKLDLEATMLLSAQKSDEILLQKFVDMTVQYKEILSNNKRILTLNRNIQMHCTRYKV